MYCWDKIYHKAEINLFCMTLFDAVRLDGWRHYQLKDERGSWAQMWQVCKIDSIDLVAPTSLYNVRFRGVQVYWLTSSIINIFSKYHLLKSNLFGVHGNFRCKNVGMNNSFFRTLLLELWSVAAASASILIMTVLWK